MDMRVVRVEEELYYCLVGPNRHRYKKKMEKG
jgi:hypothetical protein